MLSISQSSNRFVIKKQLGQGSFSIFLIHLGVLYSAYDYLRKETVALKVEKTDKSKRILQLEYDILKNLQCKSLYI